MQIGTASTRPAERDHTDRLRNLLSGVSALALVASSSFQAEAEPRGYWTPSGAAAAAASAATAGSQQAAAAAARSQESLTAAANAIRGMWNAQAAARAVAIQPGNVVDGLGKGIGRQVPGLVVDPRVPKDLAHPKAGDDTNLWINASLPSQTKNNGQTNVTIHQTAPRAVLTWEYFNIGPNTVLVFDQQGNASWVALNRIDATGVPSQIQGRIKADGSVLLINPNGIVFGGTSQINTGSLIASSLDIDSSTAASVFNGLPNYRHITADGLALAVPPNEDSANRSYIASGLYSIAATSGAGLSVAFSLGDQSLGSRGGGAITVQPGASITASATANDSGYVGLLGTTVTNAGGISTQNGQIILAAGSSIQITEPAAGATGVNTARTVTANTSLTPTNMVPVPLGDGGSVKNDTDAILVSNDGAVTLVGDKISQLGGIEATTSVTRTGSIKLDTTNGSSGTGGHIILGSGSITAILPDESSGTIPTVNATGANFTATIQPRISITALGSVDVQRGALIKAPSATLTMVAGNGAGGPTGTGTILLETGSHIDLSGLAGVRAAVTDYAISILVTAALVADDPLAASLIGKTVTIDGRLTGTRADGFQWVGSPILDAAGYAGTIPRTIDELLTVGGSILVPSPGIATFVQRQGAVIDVSGGSIDYLGAAIKTTQLLGANGRIYDIGSADPTVAYVGIAGRFTDDHSQWNATKVYTNPLIGQGFYEPAYTTGANAGSVNIQATTPVLDGSIVASTVVGRRQRMGFDSFPQGAALTLAFSNAESLNPYSVVLEPRADAGTDPFNLGSFVFGATSWSPSLSGNIFPVFTDALSATGFGSITITGPRQLSMPSDASLTVQPGGKITLGNVTTIDGRIVAASGSIAISGYNYPVANGLFLPAPTSEVLVGPHAVLDVRGLWVNDTGNFGDASLGAAFVDGGSVSVGSTAASQRDSHNGNVFTDATQSIVLARGSVIDVSSGGYVDANGRLRYGSDGLPLGKGGSVSLTTYNPIPGAPALWIAYDPLDLASNTRPSAPNQPNRANVILDGVIYAEGFDGGGTFTLRAPTIAITGQATTITSHTSGVREGEIVLPASFFADNGFSGYALTSTFNGITVADGTNLTLRQSNYLPSGSTGQVLSGLPIVGAGDAPVAPGTLPDYRQPTGAIPRVFEPVGLQPYGLRKPVGLTLSQSAYQFAASGDPAASAGILIEPGAKIVGEPQAAIRLQADGPVTVLGSITAPAGSIALVNGNSTIVAPFAPQDVWIGAGAILDVGSVFVPNPLVATYSTGRLLDAGVITLDAGTVAVAPGGRLLLEGASATAGFIDAAGSGGSRFLNVPIWSNGGTLQLFGSNIYFGGSVEAAGGAQFAAGGSLIVGNSSASANVPLTSIVIEPGDVIATNLPRSASYAYPATPLRLAELTPTQKGAYISADTLSDSGFNSVALSAQAVAFAGRIDVSVPGSLILSASNGTFALLPSSAGLLPPGVSDPTRYTPPPCPSAAACVPSIRKTMVNLEAGYVQLIGANLQTSIAPPRVADGALNITAQWIDLQGVIGLTNVSNVNLTSAGAVRLLPDRYGSPIPPNQTTFGGALITPGNLTLTAAEIFPVSETQFLLMSIGTIAGVDNKLTIQQNGLAAAPLSVGGTIVVDAQTIVQAGTLWAPLGTIVVGVTDPHKQVPGLSTLLATSYCIDGQACTSAPVAVTNSVTLAPGSLTSVSAAGLVLPYGYTVDGETWYLGAPSLGTPATVVAAPPTKTISLFGADIATRAGAVIDARGGGDIYATEFVSGTGGTRNILSTYEIDLLASIPGDTLYTAQYSDGRQVYALVPSYAAKVAAYDPTFANYPYYSGVTAPTGSNLANLDSSLLFGNAITPGSAVTIAAGNGIAAGTYVLLPGMYSTLPGAYRVVQIAGGINPTTAPATATADGSLYIAGRAANLLTGARSSQTSLFEVQPKSAWDQYSAITITSGTSFFSKQAVSNGTAVPPLPIDGGVLTIGATSTLSLNGTNRFAGGSSILAPGSMGEGGQVQISAADIVVLASDRSAPARDGTGRTPYLVLDADEISGLGATSVLIGGTAEPNATGVTITPDALDLVIATDAAHPLTGPELILVTKGGDKGLVVESGSVIRAEGSGAAGSGHDITIGANPVKQSGGSYSPGIVGDSALLRVSTGTPVAVTQLYVPGVYKGPGPLPPGSTPLGRFTIEPGVVIDGGNALTLASSGSGTLAADAKLVAKNYDLAGDVINIGGGSSGLVLTAATLANFAGADSVQLRSASTIDFFDAAGLEVGDPRRPIGVLTFDAGALVGRGGLTTIDAGDVVFTDTQANQSGPLGGARGTLVVDARGTITQGLGSQSLGNFGRVTLDASQAIVFDGTGTLDAGTADVTLRAPMLLVNGSASQALTTKGALDIERGPGSAPAVAATNVGGALTVTAASISDNGVIEARSGKLVLEAKSGDIRLGPGAQVIGTGSTIQVLDQTLYAPGGKVSLLADGGNVSLDPRSSVDVSAAGYGYAGALTITTAPTGTATLGGALLANAAFDDVGGELTLTAGTLSGALPLSSGFTRSFVVTVEKGDITLAAGSTLTSGHVALTANSGSVIVGGVIDASSSNGGEIALYSAEATTVEASARLLARYRGTAPGDPGYANGTSALVQTGGTIVLGVTGTPDGSIDPTYGYQNVSASGAITVASGAILDVSGGVGGVGITNAGGMVVLRAPILTHDHVNVGFHGTIVTNAESAGSPSGKGIVLDAYATWSTKDPSIGGHHFDGIIDPTGWYSSKGILLPGRFTNASGTTVATWNGTTLTSVDGLSDALSYYLTNAYFTPTEANADHIGFYQQTLVGFVQKFSATADYSGAQLALSGRPPVAVPTALLHSRPEIELDNSSSTIVGGNIIVASNWNLGAGSFDSHGTYVPIYRTTTGEPGVLTLRAADNIAINATIGDGFYETVDAFGGSVLVSNLIANVPKPSGGVFDFNTTSAADLMAITPGVNNGSFSFDFVAGAKFSAPGAPPVDPDAVVASPASIDALHPVGSVTIDGHTTYTNVLPGFSPITTATIDIPTLLRTGNGSITLTAAGNVEFLDTVAPGAVYTAGVVARTPSDFVVPTVPVAYTATPNGLVSTPAWATGGGAVTIRAGQSIIGIETPLDDANGSRTGVPNGLAGQFWTGWYSHAGLSNGGGTPFAPVTDSFGNTTFNQQTAAWVNYATFFQGFGALGGGNVALRAGRDVIDVSVSLPETLVVSGGLDASDPPAAHYYGGGNLLVAAGGNLQSSAFLVGRGSGLIRVDGAVQPDALNPITLQPTGYVYDQNLQGSVTPTPLPLILAVQDGFVNVTARGAITTKSVYDPASLVSDQAVQTTYNLLPGAIGQDNNAWGNLFTTFGPASGVALTSVTGDITTQLGASSSDQNLFFHNFSVNPGGTGVAPSTIGLLLPATIKLAALAGNINANADPSALGSGNLSPYPTQAGAATGNLRLVALGSITLTGSLAMPDLRTTTSQFIGSTDVSIYSNYISPLGVPLANLTQALHAHDPAPAIVAAGQDIDVSGVLGVSSLTLIKPAEIEAGRDIIGSIDFVNGFTFIGQNNNSGDITTFSAGRDIIGGNYTLYGPGTLLFEAGRNIGPLNQSVPGQDATVGGVMAVGDGSNIGGGVVPVVYLPHQSANIDILFGIAPGIDYRTAISRYVDPAHAGTDGIDLLTGIATLLAEGRDRAWADFQKLPSTRQHLLVDDAFLDFLKQVATDYSNTASPYFGQYARAYEAIETLFPSGFGYTRNAAGTNSTTSQVATGRLDISQSVLETQMGGDINIIGPGGGIVVGSTSLDVLSPVQEGILTLAGGTIRAFTDGSIQLNQSRILTLQGGDIDLFSANGDISAGAGPKTYVSNPPINQICDENGYCRVDPAGLVSGAGIGALITLPGQDPSKSNVSLAAPHGSVDAGAAGIRVSGNLNIVALQILNAYNVQVQGASVGLPTAPTSNVVALTSASNTAGAAAATATPAAGKQSDQGDAASVFIVQVIGYGGGDSAPEGSDSKKKEQSE